MDFIRARHWSLVAFVSVWAVALAAAPAQRYADAAEKQSGKKGAGGVATAHLPGGRELAVPNAPEARLFRTGMTAVEPLSG